MGEAQTEAAVAICGRAAGATSNAAVRCVAATGAATPHAARARIRSCRVGLRSRRIRAIPVGAPFPNVAAHVVDAQFVRGLGLDGMRGGGRIGKIPGYIVNRITAAVKKAI